MTKHGGKRPGAGRPTDLGETKQGIQVRLTPTVIEFLRSKEKSAGAQIERVIRRTKAFREWNR